MAINHPTLASNTVDLKVDRVTDIDDRILFKLDEANGAGLGVERGGSADAESARARDEPPFDIRVLKPRAVDLRKLYALVNQPVPADVQAALGPRVPVLLYQGLTP